MSDKVRILVAPLDWGLGHATRCVPAIRELLRQGAQPIIGSSGRARSYLQSEFSQLPFVQLPAYDIRYPTRNMFWNIGMQGGKLAGAVWKEYRRLQQLIEERDIHAVISDNRFGCFSRHVPSVFITHQINMLIPGIPLKWAANRLNRFFIRQYRECWIPALPGRDSLAGELSTPFSGMDFRHLGILSRFSSREGPKEYDILVLLSGPEPQRSLLERELVRQLKSLPYRTLLVQGRTEENKKFQYAPQLEAVSFLTSHALERAIASSGLVACRSGYSTIMDLAAMGKKALLIPTPGQTEQQYLAERMQFKGYCPYQTQGNIRLEEGIKLAQRYKGIPRTGTQNEGLKTAVSHLMEWAASPAGKWYPPGRR